MSGGSSLKPTGGLDVNELSQRLATIPVVTEDEPEASEASSTAAVLGSEADGETQHMCMYL